jgi:hypothetical protein
MRLSDQPDLFCQLQQLNPHICARNNHVWGWIHTETWLLCLREYIDSDAKLWLELEALTRPGFFCEKRLCYLAGTRPSTGSSQRPRPLLS